MRCGLFILAMFFAISVSGQDARAAEFGTRTKYQHLQELTAKSPQGEALALGYETVTHSFLAPYKMTGAYVLVVKGSTKGIDGRPIDVYHEMSAEKIEDMQRTGALPNPLPSPRHTIFEYIFAYTLWWFPPVALLFGWIFTMLGIGSSTRNQARAA